ncbi:MAG: DUF1013 domain-containing protein [Rhodospirillaceae bacterium]|nr:DUF1013 domain-containing protein [Rhodospirillaceae bacterium]
MTHPLMPKATAVWLVENTALTFDQIADFCGLHALEVQAIADEEVAIGMQGLDPIAAGELTVEEIDRCLADSGGRLVRAKVRTPVAKQKGARYTPVSKRQDRPDAIAWLLKNYPDLGDAQISKLIGTTKPTINSIRDRSHWNMPNIKAQNPVNLGLCSSENLEKAVGLAQRRIANAAKRVAKKKRQAATEKAVDAELAGEEAPVALLPASAEPELLPAPAAENAPEPIALPDQEASHQPIQMPAAKPEDDKA